MADLTTTLAVWRPSQQWTILFEHTPYAPALWALLFDPEETLLASQLFGAEWPRISAEAVLTDHVAGYRTTAGQAKDRLVRRLGPLRAFQEAWRAFSLTSALALALTGLPNEWPLRFDASHVTLRQGGRYPELLEMAVKSAATLATEPPASDAMAVQTLLSMAHGMNPQTILQPPPHEDNPTLHDSWPPDGVVVRQALLGNPVNCPTSHVKAMTRARRRWEAEW